MAKKKSGSAGSGAKGLAWAVFILIVIGGFLLAFAQKKGIDSISNVIQWSFNTSTEIKECLDGVDWKCDTTIPQPGDPSIPTIPEVDSNKTLPSIDTPSLPGTPQAPQLPEVPSFSGGSSEVVANTPAHDVVSVLESLNVSERDNSAYKRSEWKHWVGSPCNTRETVLVNSGVNVKTDPKTCKILDGQWFDPYTGETITGDAKNIDIDHIIPLKATNLLGGASWSPEKKQAYANDPEVLVAVSAKENRSKSDKGPSEYMPPNTEYHCEYAKRWTYIAKKYDLNVTPDDLTVLTGVLLSKCSQ